ncbi:hypothetical protein [Candidatus Nitrosotenuis aquarius]|uniref:hypothetical protein n=1 Tax=Candidatus Nitrosotenuis aquarius TaxID=1846278 RepID=UPI000C1F9120|nr:hypothetical protein [Candidatus Nitrosotenuis aquarius]
MFSKKTKQESINMESDTVPRIPLSCADEFPTHERSKTGDIFVIESNLKTAIAVCYPKVGVRWVDSFDSTKVLGRNTSFAENPVLHEDFRYKNELHSKLFWESVDENSYVNIPARNLVFRLDDAENHSFAFDLGKPISESWGLRFNLNIAQLNLPSEGISRFFFGLSSKNQNISSNEPQSFIGLELQLAIVETYVEQKALVKDSRGSFYNVPKLSRTTKCQFGALDVSDATLNKDSSMYFSHPLKQEHILVEIIQIKERNYLINLRTESGELIESKSVECTMPPRNLRYICAKNLINVRKGGHVSGAISNVMFYDGVTDT